HRKPAIRKGDCHHSIRISGGNSNNFTQPQPDTQIHPNTTQEPHKHKENKPTNPPSQPKNTPTILSEPHHTTQQPAVEHQPPTKKQRSPTKVRERCPKSGIT
ncbi:MAG TPA: hypothetical protein VJP90_04250, partial [Paenarthrobacter sp.]|nr:hypothetical protein [Paenarthrobacter sp.]